MAETPTYSHHDIARYLQRRMSPQEMHAFEKALMDDPLLADALEGFSASDAALAQAHLSEIEQRIAGKRERTKVIPLFIKKSTWWKAAAVVLVVITGSIISYSLLQQKETQGKIAQEMRADTTNAPVLQQDGTVPSAKPLERQAAPPEKEAVALQRSKPAPVITLPKAAPAPAVSDEKKQEAAVEKALAGRAPGVAVADSATSSSLYKSRSFSPAPTRMNELSGKVMDTRGEPLPFATIIDNNTRKETTADANGNFKLQSADSTASVAVNAAGYHPATARIGSSLQQNNIVLKEDGAPLTEVIVTANKSMKRKDAAIDSTGTAEPVGGWKNFRQYLNQQVDSLQITPSKWGYVSDDVVLEFSIDRYGNPSNIKVPKQTNQAVAGKAVEILNKGPKWKKGKKDKKIKVVIPFGSGK